VESTDDLVANVADFGRVEDFVDSENLAVRIALSSLVAHNSKDVAVLTVLGEDFAGPIRHSDLLPHNSEDFAVLAILEEDFAAGIARSNLLAHNSEDFTVLVSPITRLYLPA
jgi:hypothetical protein